MHTQLIGRGIYVRLAPYTLKPVCSYVCGVEAVWVRVVIMFGDKCLIVSHINDARIFRISVYGGYLRYKIFT